MKFIEYNANPKNKKTGDCVIRAISFATNTKWEVIYRNLSEQGIKKGLMINDSKNWKRYLETLEYEIQKLPRRPNNQRYTLEEFCDEIAEDNKTYIVNIANHLTVVKNKNLYDTWNCCKKYVGNYWVINDEI